MTNKAIKNAQHNMQVQFHLKNEARNLSKCALVIRTMRISKANAVRFIQAYEDKYVAEWEKQDMAGREYDLQKKLKQIGIDYSEIISYSRATTETSALMDMAPKNKATMIECFAEGVGVMFIALNDMFGFGKVRLHRVLDRMRGYTGDAIEDLKEKLNFSLTIDDGKLRNHKGNPRKNDTVSRQDAYRIKKGLAAFKALQGEGV